MVGLQVAARAEGTLRPLQVQADLLAGDTVIATRMLQVFPSTTFQLRRVAFDRPASPGPVVVRFQALAGQAGGVVYGATREDRQPDSDLRLDGQVEFADQDLALRVLYRRSLWTHVESQVGDLRAPPRGRGPHPRGHGGRPRPVGDRSNSFFASESSQRSTQPAMTTPEKRLAAIVLAAGESTRMGQPKALLPWGGVPLVRHQVDLLAAQPAVDLVIVVVGGLLDEVQATLDSTPARVVTNPRFRKAGPPRWPPARVPLRADQPASSWSASINRWPPSCSTTGHGLAGRARCPAAANLRRTERPSPHRPGRRRPRTRTGHRGHPGSPSRGHATPPPPAFRTRRIRTGRPQPQHPRRRCRRRTLQRPRLIA